MIRDDIILMAREAGLTDPVLGECVTDYGDATESVLRFAALVASAEREAIIDIVAIHGGSIEIEAAIRARGEKK